MDNIDKELRAYSKKYYGVDIMDLVNMYEPFFMVSKSVLQIKHKDEIHILFSSLLRELFNTLFKAVIAKNDNKTLLFLYGTKHYERLINSDKDVNKEMTDTLHEFLDEFMRKRFRRFKVKGERYSRAEYPLNVLMRISRGYSEIISRLDSAFPLYQYYWKLDGGEGIAEYIINIGWFFHNSIGIFLKKGDISFSVYDSRGVRIQIYDPDYVADDMKSLTISNLLEHNKFRELSDIIIKRASEDETFSKPWFKNTKMGVFIIHPNKKEAVYTVEYIRYKRTLNRFGSFISFLNAEGKMLYTLPDMKRICETCPFISECVMGKKKGCVYKEVGSIKLKRIYVKAILEYVFGGDDEAK